MFELVKMWALVEALGLLCLPLTIIVFHNLPDLGWAFSKTLGVTLFTFVIWLPLMCFRELPYSQPFLWGVGIIFLGVSVAGFWLTHRTMRKAFRRNRSYMILTEIIFLGMVALLGFLRQFRPDIRSWETFMDEGMIAGIMRSPHLPPNDVWYSGSSINYYYYAHFIAATLGKTIGQSPSIVFNTAISIFFGLTALNLFGVTSNIVAWAKQARFRLKGSKHTIPQPTLSPSPHISPLLRAAPFGLCSLAMGVLFGNLASASQWWIDTKTSPGVYEWFSPSRVIPNTINEFPAFSFLLSDFHAHVLTLAFTLPAIGVAFNLFIGHDKPGLSVFGQGWRLPFALVASALIIGQLFVMNGWDYPTYLALALVCLILQQWLAHGSRLSIDLVLDVFTASAVLGALSFCLFVPFYLSFISPAQGLGLVDSQDRSTLSNEFAIYGLFAFILISFLVACFFRPRLRVGHQGVQKPYSSSSPQSASREPEALVKSEAKPTLTRPGISQTSPDLSVTSPVQNEAGQHPAPTSAEQESAPEKAIQVQDRAPVQSLSEEAESGESDEEHDTETGAPTLLTDRGWLDMHFIGLLVTLLAAFLVLLLLKNSVTFVITGGLAAIASILTLSHLKERSRSFVLLLGAVACALVAFCEVVYLKDVFSGGSFFRMNTVFKFYFQAWMLFSVACGSGLFFLCDAFWPEDRKMARQPKNVSRQLRTGLAIPWAACLLLLVLASLVYPRMAPSARLSTYNAQTRTMSMSPTWNLDGMTYLQHCRPPDIYPSMDSDPVTFCLYDVTHDYAAIRWINAHIQGDPVIVEAANASNEDYSLYALVSSFTGLPTIMGWPGHEVQWRANWLQNPANSASFNQRLTDINTIYTNPNPQVVLNVMRFYHAEYLYVGSIEHAAYPHADLTRFASFMQTVYNRDGVAIYKLPD
jgi:uncharacterized membrane protein